MMVTLVSGKAFSRALLDVLIRAGLIVALAIICYRVFHPFLDLMLWSLILAVTLYPIQRRLQPRLKGRNGRTAVVIVAVAICVLLVPIYLLGDSMTASVEKAITLVRSGSFQVPFPNDAVAGWPVIGKPLHALWLDAATDLSSVTERFSPQLRAAGLTMLKKLVGFGVGLLLFMVALVIAGIFMAYGESGNRSAIQIASRIFGEDRGVHITALCTSTIRAVALGVIGIAFIQMLLVGVGFVVIGVPGAGLLAIAALLLGIMQIPVTLITLPVIAYVFANQGVSGTTIIFAVYVFIAGLVDNVLKPLLLGRGVDVPMPVVLIGALGGMVTGGVIGLFIGPVILAVGYELFWQWVKHGPYESNADRPDAAKEASLTFR